MPYLQNSFFFFFRGKGNLWGQLWEQTEKEETSEMKYHTLKLLGYKNFDNTPILPFITKKGLGKVEKKKEISNFAFRENS